MKRWSATVLLFVGLSSATLAQGTVNFANVAGPATARSVDAPFFNIDRVTRMTGPDWVAQLYAGPSPSSLEPVGPYVPFMTGAGAGYFQGGTRVIPTVAPGAAATVVVRVWQVSAFPTWEEAWLRLETVPLTVITGGAGIPPSIPANLSGLQAVAFIPEPSTVLLAGAGLLVVLFRRLRK